MLTDEHILPESERSGLILNIPETRLDHYYPSSTTGPSHRNKKEKERP